MKCRHVMKNLYLAIALAFWPCALMGVLFMDESGWYELSVVLYYIVMLPCVLLPCYLAYLELGACVGRLFDGKERTRGELVLGWVTTAVAVLIPVSLCLHFADGLPRALEVSRSLLLWVYALLLPILWIVGRVRYRKSLHLQELLRPKGVWVTAMVLLLFVLVLGVLVFRGNHLGLPDAWHMGGKPDPMG